MGNLTFLRKIDFYYSIIEINNMNYILIDGSYFIFFRFYAMQLWWKHAKKDEESHDMLPLEPAQSEEFIKKFKSTFVSKIKEIPKKLKIKQPFTIMVAKDCPQKEIWRHTHFEKYKATRDDTPAISPFFKLSYESLFEEAGCKTVLSCPCLEADDCVALTTRYICEKDKDAKVWIIASDMDYAQLNSDRVTIMSLKYTNLMSSKHVSGNAEMDLFCKIVSGDKSDNIPSVFPRCGPKTAVKYFSNMSEFHKKLENNEKAKDIYNRNRQIIDFNYIPKHLQEEFTENCLQF